MSRFDDDAGAVVADISESIVPLGQGALITGIILGAMVVHIIDVNYLKATAFALTGSVASFVGIIHAPALAFNASPEYSIGYLALALMFFIISRAVSADKLKQVDTDDDISSAG